MVGRDRKLFTKLIIIVMELYASYPSMNNLKTNYVAKIKNEE